MPNDGALLSDYARTGSESAFGALVARHIDMVYSTALRSAHGDEALARDVSQTVFIDLVRKASRLTGRSDLTGWLYVSTCFAAAKAVRTEVRRRRREQEAHTMHEPVANTPDLDWEQVGPLLNRAMLSLKEAEREALLLRFFERKPLGEVGRQLGLTENAARMRVERALDRLRQRLRRDGITSSATALGLMLTQHAVVAAPVGLAASVSAAGAATTVGVSLLNGILMSNAKLAAVGAVILAGALTPAILQYRTNARLRAEVEAMRAQATVATAPSQSNSGEAERLRDEHAELLRLRGEVTTLHSLAAKPNTTADSNEFQRLKAAQLAKMASEAASAEVLLAKAPDIPMLPANTWTNLGFATPASALQTLNWAVANRDTNAFLNAVGWDPQVRARAEALFAALPDSVRQEYGSIDGVIMDWLLRHATPMAAFRVLSQSDQGPDDMSLLEQHQYTDERVRENTLQFHRDENGAWRQVLPPELMPKLTTVINNLAGTPGGAAGK
jgi:RNA polymerase sigma factor (sigma-70 family)